MRWFGIAIGALIILASAMSMVAPDLRLAVEGWVLTPGGLYALAVARIVLGLMFVFAAPVSRAPRIIRGLGFIVIIAGLSTPLFGVARSRAVVDWFENSGPLWMRVDAIVGMTLGGVLVYLFRPPTPRAT